MGEKRRVAIIASKGTLDMAYPPLIVATAAAAMGWEAGIFFTFYGLDIVNKKKYKKLKVSPIANPAAPIPVPNILGVIPGMTAMATWMMKRFMRKQQVPPLPEMLGLAKRLGVRLFGCTTTMGVMSVAESDLLEGVECAGAGGFLAYAAEAQVTLFVWMASPDGERKRVAVIASRGGARMAYPPLLIATAAAAMGWEAGVFFTLDGLKLVDRKRKWKPPRSLNLSQPSLPLVGRWLRRGERLPPLTEVMATARRLGVRLYGCTTCMGAVTLDEADLVEGVESAGLTTLLEYASRAQVTLFI